MAIEKRPTEINDARRC